MEEYADAVRQEAAQTAAAAAEMPGGLPALGAWRLADMVTPIPAASRLLGYNPDIGSDASTVGDALNLGLWGLGAAVPAVRAMVR